jgi:G3E family GTPase
MRLIIVAGLLGVGKTSVILRMLDPMMAKGLKVVVIENDFGAMGVDSEVLEKNGMKVRDLKGGCICCTLQSGLVDSLRLLQIEYDPDYVIVEPSGIADPEFVINSVTDIDGIDLDGIFSAIVVDCERFLKVKRMFERPLRNQLKVADIALLNKIDTASPEDLDTIEGDLKGLGYDGPTARIRGDTGEGIERFSEALGI